MIGVGLPGHNHLDLLFRRTDVDLVTICEVDDRTSQMSKAIIAKCGKPLPKILTSSNDACKKNVRIERDKSRNGTIRLK